MLKRSTYLLSFIHKCCSVVANSIEYFLLIAHHSKNLLLLYIILATPFAECTLEPDTNEIPACAFTQAPDSVGAWTISNGQAAGAGPLIDVTMQTGEGKLPRVLCTSQHRIKILLKAFSDSCYLHQFCRPPDVV